MFFLNFFFRFDPIFETNDGPLLQIIKHWFSGIEVVISATQRLFLRAVQEVGADKFKFLETQIRNQATLTINTLPENLSNWMYTTFEEQLCIFEVAHPDKCTYEIQEVRDTIRVFCEGFLKHEVQAVWAAFGNEKDFTPFDVFCNNDREFYNVTDVLERWTTVKLATVYYAAILSLKYSHLTIPKESLFTLFKVSIEDTKLDYYAYGGQVLPSFDFVMKLAASHRSAVRRSILFLHRFI